MSQKKLKLHSLVHQFYKELVAAKKLGFKIAPLINLLPSYLKQNRIRHNRMELGIPWIQKDAFHYLDNFIQPGFRVFEYGAGASTHYFLKKKVDLVSVEHDSFWYDSVRSFLELKGLDHDDLNLIVPQAVSNEIRMPVLSSRDSRFLDCDFSKYASYIDRYPDGSFDVVLIDGRVRVECLKYAITKLKKSGILIFDNSERIDYRQGLDSLELKCVFKKFGIVEYDLWFCETSIFRW